MGHTTVVEERPNGNAMHILLGKPRTRNQISPNFALLFFSTS